MDTQVLVVAELCQNRIRNSADTHLKRRTVFDQGRAVLADAGFDLVGFGEMCLFQRGIVLYEEVDFRRVDHCVAERTGNVLVHHCDHRTSRFHGCQGRIDRGAERNVAVFVGRRYLDHRYVARYRAAAIELLGFAQKDGNVVRIAALRHFAHVPAHEERVELEDAFELRIGIGSRPFRVQVVDVHILEFVVGAAFAHGLNQALGGRSDRAEVNMVTRFDDFHGFGCRCEFNLSVHFFFSYFR